MQVRDDAMNIGYTIENNFDIYTLVYLDFYI